MVLPENVTGMHCIAEIMKLLIHFNSGRYDAGPELAIDFSLMHQAILHFVKMVRREFLSDFEPLDWR